MFASILMLKIRIIESKGHIESMLITKRAGLRLITLQLRIELYGTYGTALKLNLQ